MSSTHKEALDKANYAYCRTPSGRSNLDLEAAIRAYLDARGLVMVPKRMTYPMGVEINLTGTFKQEALQVRYAAMLAAAPDPFRDDAP